MFLMLSDLEAIRRVEQTQYDVLVLKNDEFSKSGLRWILEVEILKLMFFLNWNKSHEIHVI